MRKIQSFVRRGGRLTQGQKTGLNELWMHYGVDMTPQTIDFVNVFTKPQPIILEIGFGNGDSLLEMATQSPNKNFLGVEVYEAGVGRLISRAKKYELKNLKVAKCDAVELLKNNILDNTLSGFQLFFPAPWHKKKHNKRRIVNVDFLNLLALKLKEGASVHMATDWEEYAIHMMEVLELHPQFHNTLNAHTFAPRPEYRPITKFERRGEELGHGVWDLIFTYKK
jgi:tRNA (guanine-N7-)-methyltransferase